MKKNTEETLKGVKKDDSEQSQRFVETAKTLGCDESSQALDDFLGKSLKIPFDKK